MKKVRNLSSIRNAARLACKQEGLSIKDKSITVFIIGFTGHIDNIQVSNKTLYNIGHKWYWQDNVINFISGVYSQIAINKSQEI